MWPYSDPFSRALGHTREGRRILDDPAGGYETEKSTTVEVGGQWFNIPTIFEGQHVSDDEAVERVRAAGWRDPDTGRTLDAYPDEHTAVSAAQARSQGLDEDLRRAGLLDDSGSQEMPNLFGARRPPTSSPLFPDPTNPVFDPFSQPAPPGADAFGPLSTALGDPEAIEPQAFGLPGSGAEGTLLGMLMKLLGKAGKGGRSSQVSFADEMLSKPWGVRYDTPSTRDFGGGPVRQSSRGFASESGREG